MDFNEMTPLYSVVTDGNGNIYVLDGDTGYPLANTTVEFNADSGESEEQATSRAVREAMEQAMERKEFEA